MIALLVALFLRAAGAAPTCGAATGSLGLLAKLNPFLRRGPLDALKGEWHFQYLGHDRSLKIEDDHIFHDSEFGKGDIQHVNGDRYHLTYYATDDLYGQFECELVLEKIDANTIGSITMEKEGMYPCRMGQMKRMP